LRLGDRILPRELDGLGSGNLEREELKMKYGDGEVGTEGPAKDDTGYSSSL